MAQRPSATSGVSIGEVPHAARTDQPVYRLCCIATGRDLCVSGELCVPGAIAPQRRRHAYPAAAGPVARVHAERRAHQPDRRPVAAQAARHGCRNRRRQVRDREADPVDHREAVVSNPEPLQLDREQDHERALDELKEERRYQREPKPTETKLEGGSSTRTGLATRTAPRSTWQN